MDNIYQLLQGVRGPAVRCGLHDKSLQGKRLQITDAIAFLGEVEREVSAQEKMLDYVSIAGIVAWSAVLVTNIIRNTVKVAPVGRQLIVLRVLDEIHKKTSGQRFEGNRYSEEIKNIEKAKDALRKSVPSQFQELVNLFGDMATDSIGMTGFLQDSDDTKRSLKQSVKSAQKQIRDLRNVLRKIDARIADDMLNDDGGQSAGKGQYMTPASAASGPGIRLH